MRNQSTLISSGASPRLPQRGCLGDKGARLNPARLGGGEYWRAPPALLALALQLIEAGLKISQNEATRQMLVVRKHCVVSLPTINRYGSRSKSIVKYLETVGNISLRDASREWRLIASAFLRICIKYYRRRAMTVAALSMR